MHFEFSQPNTLIKNEPLFDFWLASVERSLKGSSYSSLFLFPLLVDIHFSKEFNSCFAYPNVI